MAKQSDAEFIVDTYRFNALGYVHDVLGVERVEEWQAQVLKDVSEGVRKIAVSSGHGIGKTALTSWLNHWFMSTRPHPQIVITANTETQLKTKTWRELAKWNNQALNKDWFDYTATKFSLREAPETWFASAIPWTENRSEAFAGTHEDHVLYIFDEASAIADIIFEVSEGAMTGPEAIWLMFGNPTKNTGRFRECWGKFSHRWKTYQVDSREVEISDKKQIEEWIEDYGEDSDFCRVRIKGQFPRAGSNQFISSEDVDKCMNLKLDPENYETMPLVFGVDVARFGEDQNCLLSRQGRKVFKIRRWRGLDTMQSAEIIYEEIKRQNPQVVFIDGVGVGGGVVDRLKQLVGNDKIYEVNGGSKPEDKAKYFNLRAEMWGKMRDAVQAGIDLPGDTELEMDLIGPEYGFDNKNRIQLEKKDSMKKRGLKSPDGGDALSMTYARAVIGSKKAEFKMAPGGFAW